MSGFLGTNWFNNSYGTGAPESISQSNFEAWFQSGTLSTFTYEDSTYGNYLVLASPGGNTFIEHNSIKQIPLCVSSTSSTRFRASSTTSST